MKKVIIFLPNKYELENIISAHVHTDATTSHLHFAFAPVTKDGKKGIEKVLAKEILTRDHLKRFHGELSNHMGKAFGRDIGILNGITGDNNKTVVQLKREDANIKPFEKDSYYFLVFILFIYI